MDIITITSSYVNTYLVPVEGGYCMIDTGYKQQEKTFWKKFAKKGLKPEQIKYVFLTHHHADHAGFLKSVLEKTGAQLISAEGNRLRLAAGKNDMQTYISSFPLLVLSKLSVAFVGTTQCFPPVTAPELDPSGQPLEKEGITFKILRGHTDCDVVMQVGEKLFCGDLLMSGIGAQKYAPMWIKNKFEMVKSWEKLLKMPGIDTIYPGHGKPFSISVLPGAIDAWKKRGALSLSAK